MFKFELPSYKEEKQINKSTYYIARPTSEIINIFFPWHEDAHIDFDVKLYLRVPDRRKLKNWGKFFQDIYCLRFIEAILTRASKSFNA